MRKRNTLAALAALILFILIGSSCSYGNGDQPPGVISRRIAFRFTFPEETEPEVVVDVQVRDQTCSTVDEPDSNASLFYRIRLDISDSRNRSVEPPSEVPVVVRCLVLTPLVAPEVGVSYPYPGPETRLASGVDTVKLDVDIPIGFGDTSEIRLAVDF